MFRNFIGGLFFASLMFTTSFLGSIFLMGPTLPLLLISPKWFRWVNDKLMGKWLVLPCGILEVLFGMRLFITMENFMPEFKNDKAVIIMNHKTRLDWLYYWSVVLRHGKLENEKIILKNGLKHIPGPGWAMQVAMFIFLQRRWEEDELYLRQILRYFTDNNYPLQLLLFPEGTDYSDNTLAKSKSYAIKNNLPIYRHVLHPRLRGFSCCLEQLKRCKGVDAIHDVTVGYPGSVCQSEFDMLAGNFPKEVHFHIKRYPIEELPKSSEELEKWCAQRWAEKEETLETFYKRGKFEFKAKGEEKRSRSLESRVRWEMIFWIVFWLAFSFAMPVLLYLYTWMRWYALVVGIMYYFQSTFGGGLEMLQVRRNGL